MQFATALKITLALHLHVVLNVPLVLNVVLIRLALTKNARILVRALAVKMQDVRLQIIIQYAAVRLAIMAIHLLDVSLKRVSFPFYAFILLSLFRMLIKTFISSIYLCKL